MKEVATFVISGFLESGKSTLINDTIKNGQFHRYGTTLLIVCEEGEITYDERELFKYNTDLLIVSEDELTKDFLNTVVEFYNPARIIIEMNSMWQLSVDDFPKELIIKQNIALVDYNTFENYFKNMRQIIYNIIKNAEIVIFNRCEENDEKLSNYKRIIQSINPNIQSVFENESGQIDVILEEELPYDISKDYIEIKEEDYGIWYIDSMQNPTRYIGKTIQFAADILEEEKTNALYAGRNVMSCCENDISFWGHPITDNSIGLNHEDYVLLKVKIYEGENGFLGLEPLEKKPLKKKEKNFLQF